jgi:hypothetical protein
MKRHSEGCRVFFRLGFRQAPSADTATDALAGNEVESEAARVVVLFVQGASQMFVILVADAHPAAFCARVSLVRPDGIEDLSGRIAFDGKHHFLVVRPGRCWISKSSAIDSVRGSCLQIWPGIGVSGDDRRRK